MSGNPTGSNVVPMPHAATPAPAQPPMPMPGMWGGGSLPWGPGCCPPGGMDALMKCYCDVQAATAFICSVMVQCVQNNPAVVEAIIAAIEASGSSLPLIGVTNGVAAQPGQVGEAFLFEQTLNVAAGNSTPIVVMGTLPPGDWDCWAYIPQATIAWSSLSYELNPVPAGFTTNMFAGMGQNDIGNETTTTATVQALTSAPSLIAFQFQIGTATAAGAIAFNFGARRRR